MQKCKFFMEHLRVTQGYGYDANGNVKASYSHAGSYALDLGGKDTGLSWAYAPCDVIVKRIYGNYNAVWFETLEEVMCADGQARKLVFMLLHMNNSDKNAIGLTVGKVIRQGEKFYREGTAGNVTGAHIHMEVGLAPFTPTGWAVNAHGVWKINNQLKPHEIFILGRDVEVLNDGGYNWTVKSTIKGAAKLEIGPASSGDLNTLFNMIVAIGGINAEIKENCIYTSEMSQGDRATLLRTCAELRVPCKVVAEETSVTYLTGPMSPGDQATLIATCQELGVHYEIVGDLNDVIPAPEDAKTEKNPEENSGSTEKNPEEKTEKTEANEPAPEETTPEAPQPEETPAIQPETPEDNKEPEKEENGEIEPNTGAGAEDVNVPDKPATDTNVGANVPDTNVGDINPKKNLFTKVLDTIVKFFKAILG